MRKNEIIVVGKEILLNVEISEAFSSVHEILTTDLIAYGLRASKTINIESFSGEEMADFVDFYHNHSVLESIGFSDSSALYLCLIKGYKYAVKDTHTQRLCQSLGISTITFEKNNIELQTPKTSRFTCSVFSKIACL